MRSLVSCAHAASRKLAALGGLAILPGLCAALRPGRSRTS